MKEKKLNLQLRDDVIYWRYLKGASSKELAREYFYNQNYIQSIIRKYKKRFENNRRKFK